MKNIITLEQTWSEYRATLIGVTSIEILRTFKRNNFEEIMVFLKKSYPDCLIELDDSFN